MKQTIIRYGLLGGLLICLLFLASWYLMPGLDFTTQEVLGYASMVLALSIVYFGIRHFRDRENSGALSLGEGLRVGLGISLITALCFGLLDVLYVVWLEPDFMDTYYASVLADWEASLPEAEFLARKQEMEDQKAMFSSPWVSFLLMFLTVFLIGFIISLLSTFILKRKPSQTA